jgi:hypothetical protein
VNEYDCSIKRRQGCNYCDRGKLIPHTTGGNRWYINDCKNELQADNKNISVETIKINYCRYVGKDWRTHNARSNKAD